MRLPFCRIWPVFVMEEEIPGHDEETSERANCHCPEYGRDGVARLAASAAGERVK
jgi:hypothetical protein